MKDEETVLATCRGRPTNGTEKKRSHPPTHGGAAVCRALVSLPSASTTNDLRPAYAEPIDLLADPRLSP